MVDDLTQLVYVPLSEQYVAQTVYSLSDEQVSDM